MGQHFLSVYMQSGLKQHVCMALLQQSLLYRQLVIMGLSGQRQSASASHTTCRFYILSQALIGCIAGMKIPQHGSSTKNGGGRLGYRSASGVSWKLPRQRAGRLILPELQKASPPDLLQPSYTHVAVLSTVSPSSDCFCQAEDVGLRVYLDMRMFACCLTDCGPPRPVSSSMPVNSSSCHCTSEPVLMV